MKFQHFLPDPRLNEIIKHYWVLENDSSSIHSEEILFPVGAIEIILHLKSPFLRLHNGTWAPEKRAFIEGQQSGMLQVKYSGPMKSVGITFYPWATSILFNTPPLFFTDQRFDVEDLDSSITQLYNDVATCNNDTMIPSFCDKYFLTLLKNKFIWHSSTDMAIINAFKKKNESFTVPEIKTDWFFSTKLFEKKFKEMIGVPAGELLKKRRMNNVMKKILLHEYKSLTDVAHTAGYYDQSHFIKDFKTYFQDTPKLLKKDHSLLKYFI